MLSRFFWRLIQPHMSQVLATHDKNMREWITEGVNPQLSAKFDEVIQLCGKNVLALRQELESMQEHISNLKGSTYKANVDINSLKGHKEAMLLRLSVAEVDTLKERVQVCEMQLNQCNEIFGSLRKVFSPDWLK